MATTLPFDVNSGGIDVHNDVKTNKVLEDWLPVTGSRNAKWWYSTFHNVTAMVGAGVLGLPHAMACLTW